MEQKQVVVELENPIIRDGKQITKVTVRMPMAGDLRGTSLQQLMSGGTAEIQTVLRRVTSPMLTESDFAEMPGADFIELSTEVMGFLTPRRYKAQAENQDSQQNS